jgi:hypothetical protein
MALNIPLSIRFTPYYAKSVGWSSNLGQICGVLGFTMFYPSPKDFVVAVSRWQAKNALDADGMLGPLTWRKMKPIVASFSAKDPMAGPYPKWVYMIDPNADIPVLPKRWDVVPNPSLASNEDRFIKEMAHVSSEFQHHSMVPVAVSSPYLGRYSYPNGLKSFATGLPISQMLAVGQEWQGVAGKRLIAGLAGGMYAPGVTYGTVLFVTESGQGYEQQFSGWESDLQAKVWADVTDDLKPIQKMLDIELAFLNGAQAGWNFPLYAAVHSGAFYLTHRGSIKQYSKIAGTILATRKLLKAVAPNLYSKVFDVVKSRIWSSLWDNLADNINAENLAKFLGMVIVTRGKQVYADLCRETAGVLRLIAKYVSRIFLLLVDSGLVLVRAVPNAAKNAARDELKTAMSDTLGLFRKLGVELTEADLKTIAEEFNANRQAIMEKIQELEENVKGL